MAFSRGATGLSHLPLCFESILRVTIESVQESQVYWKCIGTSGSFEMGTGPPEFLSSVKLRPPALEVPQERWHSFPDEAGKWTLLLGLGGKTGALLELWQDRQCSSPVLTWISGFLWSFHRGVRPRLLWRHEVRFPLKWKSSVRFPVELT